MCDIISPYFIDHYKAQIYRHEMGQDPTRFRFGALEILGELHAENNTPLFRALANDEHTEYGYVPGSWIDQRLTYFALDHMPFYYEDDNKQCFGKYWNAVKDMEGYWLRTFITHPDYRNQGFGGSTLEFLVDHCRDLNNYLVVTPRPSIELEFSPAYINFYQQMAAMQQMSLDIFLVDKDFNQTELNRCYKFYKKYGFDIQLPRLRESVTGYYRGPLLFLP